MISVKGIIIYWFITSAGAAIFKTLISPLFIEILTAKHVEEQHGTVVKVSDSGVKGSMVQLLIKPKNLFPSLLAPLLHLTCGAGVVDDKDLAFSSHSVPIKVTSDYLYTSPWQSRENIVEH